MTINSNKSLNLNGGSVLTSYKYSINGVYSNPILFTSTELANPSTFSFIIYNLTNYGNQYTIRVRFINIIGQSFESNVVNVTTINPTTRTPTQISWGDGDSPDYAIFGKLAFYNNYMLYPCYTSNSDNGNLSCITFNTNNSVLSRTKFIMGDSTDVYPVKFFTITLNSTSYLFSLCTTTKTNVIREAYLISTINNWYITRIQLTDTNITDEIGKKNHTNYFNIQNKKVMACNISTYNSKIYCYFYDYTSKSISVIGVHESDFILNSGQANEVVFKNENYINVDLCTSIDFSNDYMYFSGVETSASNSNFKIFRVSKNPAAYKGTGTAYENKNYNVSEIGQSPTPLTISNTQIYYEGPNQDNLGIVRSIVISGNYLYVSGDRVINSIYNRIIVKIDITGTTGSLVDSTFVPSTSKQIQDMTVNNSNLYYSVYDESSTPNYSVNYVSI